MLAASFFVQVLIVIGAFLVFGLVVLIAAVILFREDDQSAGNFIWSFFTGFNR